MKTIKLHNLNENAEILQESTQKGEYVLMVNEQGMPLSLAIPLDDKLLTVGVRATLAVNFYKKGLLKLEQAAAMANTSLHDFVSLLASTETESNETPAPAAKGWPEGYFDLFGAWQGEPLVRPEQPSYEPEERLELV